MKDLKHLPWLDRSIGLLPLPLRRELLDPEFWCLACIAAMLLLFSPSVI